MQTTFPCFRCCYSCILYSFIILFIGPIQLTVQTTSFSGSLLLFLHLLFIYHTIYWTHSAHSPDNLFLGFLVVIPASSIHLSYYLLDPFSSQSRQPLSRFRCWRTCTFRRQTAAQKANWTGLRKGGLVLGGKVNYKQTKQMKLVSKDPHQNTMECLSL